FFYGGYKDITTLRPIVNLPILFKDFIIDEIQIDLARSIGANIILLIVAALEKERLRELLDYANSRNLEVLIEVHNKEELDIALAFDHPLIGINNRNLKTFITDIQVSLDLIKHVNDPSVYLISESGIKSIEDVKKLSKAGFSGILVGETLIKNDVNESLINEISNVRRMFI
ncbi:MAG: indole-3-glycerol-phosphate synthase, partial [Clostridiales bacterium]|nr:indole-3-glycerol-phosphate synthase [Clostridiales bacterium]